VRKHGFNLKPNLLLSVWAFLLFCDMPAAADSVTYSFFGSAWLTGTNFTYESPSGFLAFDTGRLVPTTSTDVFFYDVSGNYFKNDIGKLANFDFVSEDELLLHTTTGCSLDFTIVSGFSHVKEACPADTLNGGSSIPAFGYLLNVYTNFDVVGTGEIGIRPTDSGSPTPEASSLMLVGLGLVGAKFLRTRKHACGGCHQFGGFHAT
jgi:hypothetical protein